MGNYKKQGHVFSVINDHDYEAASLMAQKITVSQEILAVIGSELGS